MKILSSLGSPYVYPNGLPPSRRHTEEKTLAMTSALSAAESRLVEMEALKVDVVSRGQKINERQEEALALKNAVSNANSKLVGMDALGVDLKCRTEELENCKQGRRLVEENLVKERSRTQHLVSGERRGGGWGAYSSVACLSHMTIHHVPLLTRSTAYS